MTSQTAILNFEAAILNPEQAVMQLTMTTSKIHEFVLRNILNQNKHQKVKDYLLLTNDEGEKSEKKTEKRQKIVKIHS